MITIPIYDMMILPGVTFFFKKDIFTDREITAEHVGEDVLFLMMKQDKKREDMSPEDICPIGVSGKIESIDEEGNIRVHTKERVLITDVEVTMQSISASAAICGEVEDISDEEMQKRFEALKRDLLKFVQMFQWGVWARSFILHWKNMNEILCALSGYLNLSWPEKYAVLEAGPGDSAVNGLKRQSMNLLNCSRSVRKPRVPRRRPMNRHTGSQPLKNRLIFCRTSWMRCIRRIFPMSADLKLK